MKKLFFVMAIIAFCSACHKEERPTTYQIFNNTNQVVTNIEYLDGSMYEVIVYHYSHTKLISQDTIDMIPTKGGKSECLDVPDNADLFKVSFMFLPPKSPDFYQPWNTRYYLTEFKIIVRGENNIYGINGGSYIRDTLLKSDNRLIY